MLDPMKVVMFWAIGISNPSKVSNVLLTHKPKKFWWIIKKYIKKRGEIIEIKSNSPCQPLALYI